MIAALFMFKRYVGLYGYNILRLGAFGSLSDDKFNALAFIQVTEAVINNRGVMNEYVIAGLALDEAIALRTVEPLHCALFFLGHDLELLS
jgi:hypothetical protein